MKGIASRPALVVAGLVVLGLLAVGIFAAGQALGQYPQPGQQPPGGGFPGGPGMPGMGMGMMQGGAGVALAVSDGKLFIVRGPAVFRLNAATLEVEQQTMLMDGGQGPMRQRRQGQPATNS